MKRIILLALLLCLTFGCTVIPKQVHGEASWDQDSGKQDSGFEAWLEDGSAEVTPSAKAKYDALVERYGDQFLVPIKKGDGLLLLPDGNWRIDPVHLAAWMKMARSYRAGLPKLAPQ